MNYKICIVTLFLFLGVSHINGQSVEVEGKMKITEMPNDSAANTLVVRQADGTLASRQISSISTPPQLSDTTRTFANDLEFAKVLCECSNIPPFLVESALNAGYTDRQLYEGGVDLESLFRGGVHLDSLITFGETVQNILTNTSATPMDLFDSNIAITDIYGSMYEGGLIFYLDTLNIHPSFEGLVSAPLDQSGGAPWGCSGTEVTGADDISIGAGLQNSMDILADCNDAGIAALLCDELVIDEFDDWFLPSIDELTLMYVNLHLMEIGDYSPAWYFSSTEVNSFNARLRNFSSGAGAGGSKNFSFVVRAARRF